MVPSPAAWYQLPALSRHASHAFATPFLSGGRHGAVSRPLQELLLRPSTSYPLYPCRINNLNPLSTCSPRSLGSGHLSLTRPSPIFPCVPRWSDMGIAADRLRIGGRLFRQPNRGGGTTSPTIGEASSRNDNGLNSRTENIFFPQLLLLIFRLVIFICCACGCPCPMGHPGTEDPV